jgi:hypothetical protein
MPTNRKPLRRHRRGLDHDQEEELRFGPKAGKSVFGSGEELHAAWFAHRERLMARYGQRGRRPMAWWHFESDLDYPGYDEERQTLFEAGLLGEQERADLVALWREQFEKAQRPNFTFNTGAAAGWLKDEAAKRAHYQWAGIPKSLVQQWTRK